MLKTIFILGPGGVGKSPLDLLFSKDVIKLNPYRLRARPRNLNDSWFASPPLRDHIENTLRLLGAERKWLNSKRKVAWYPSARVFFMKIRRDWQILFADMDHSKQFAKAEIFPEFLVDILSDKEVSKIFGKHKILILNPAPVSILNPLSLHQIKEITRRNCYLRGDDTSSTKSRVMSVNNELIAWKFLIKEYNALEYLNWKFPEYLYCDRISNEKTNNARSMKAHISKILTNARDALLAQAPFLKKAVLSNMEIRNLLKKQKGSLW